MYGREYRFDEIAYAGHAVRLATGQGFVDETGQLADFWPVGFPFVLAAVYRLFGIHPPWGGIGLHIFVGILTSALATLVGERSFGRSIGRLAGLVVALYPTHVFYETLLLTEPLFTLLLFGGGALLLWSLRSGEIGALLAGVVFGLAILTRPVLVLLPPLTSLWYFGNGAGARRAAVLGTAVLCAALAVLSPWLIRNRREFGTWTDLSSTGGYNFFIGNRREAFGGYANPPGVADCLKDGTRYSSSRGYRLGWEAIRAQPVLAVRRAVQKVTYFFALETDGVLWNLKGVAARVPLVTTLALLALANTAYVLVTSGCILGLLSPGPDRAFVTLFYFVGGYLLLMAVAFIGDPRFHFPLVPFAALICCKAILRDGPQLRLALRRGDAAARQRLRLWMLLNAVFVLLMLGNLWLKYLEPK